MKNENIDVLLENQSLKNEFTVRGLDLSQVFCPAPEDLERENRVLLRLLDWVQKYNECSDRKEMEAAGYLFPPIDPDLSPDNDWYRFKLWLKGQSLRKKLIDQLPQSFIPIPSDQLTDDELLSELEKLADLLEEIHFSVDLVNDVPPRLLYEHLLEVLDEEFDLMDEGFCHLDGCTGYCPGCFQRPWCESGTSSCWQEDEEAGKMVLIDSVKKFASASPTSLPVLKELQEKEDKAMAEFNKNHKDTPISLDPLPFDFDDDDDLPF